MKHVSSVILAAFLALLTACIMPAQVFADSIPEYISEVKIFTGDYSAAASEGYTLLKDGNNPVDLNQKAGGGLGSKGEKAVYLGYKTTKNSKNAITDLALMNMKGGYNPNDYDVLFDGYLKGQIIPFVADFMKVVKEYRANYNSEYTANKQRAQYIHDILNKITDDDTGMKMGDLLLKKTKYELGDKAYDALTDEQKKEYGDIVTIIAQANGKTTLVIENLVTRAADTNETTWIDRFSGLTYDNLIDSTGLPPTDAEKELAKLYDDDAQTLLNMWTVFKEQIEITDDSEDVLEELENSQSDEAALEAIDQKVEDVQNDYSDEKLADTLTDMTEEREKVLEGMEKATNAMVRDYLESVEYDDGTMLDFFLQDTEGIADDITVLYPLVASLTEGQRKGLEFMSLKDMVLIAGVDEDGYSDDALDDFVGGSVFEGVDRAIYEKGGVALTSDALRADAMTKAAEEGESEFSFKWYNYAMFALTGIAATGFLASAGYTIFNAAVAARYSRYISSSLTKGGSNYAAHFSKLVASSMENHQYEGWMNYQFEKEATDVINSEKIYNESKLAPYRANSSFGAKLTLGFGVAMVVIAAITTYLTWREMQAYYDVDFTPIPNYMVDEKDITGYNKKGEKIVLKNQSAYYKAVECNRSSSAEFYGVLGTNADMNGDVGQQWLALYAVKNEIMEPILASSLKVVVNSTQAPAGYETGIHMFGADVAFNLNSSLYDWANDALSVYIYFKTDDNAASTTGTNFSGGTLALTGGAGVALGAVVTALAMNTAKKKKENKAVSA